MSGRQVMHANFFYPFSLKLQSYMELEICKQRDPHLHVVYPFPLNQNQVACKYHIAHTLQDSEFQDAHA